MKSLMFVGLLLGLLIVILMVNPTILPKFDYTFGQVAEENRGESWFTLIVAGLAFSVYALWRRHRAQKEE